MKKKDIDKIYVNLTAAASDIIVATPWGYKNLMTCSMSYDFTDCLRKRNFLFDDSSKILDKERACNSAGDFGGMCFNKLKGYYAVHDKERDILLIILAALDLRDCTIFNMGEVEWKEKARCAFYWEGDKLRFIGDEFCFKKYSKFDIAGQTPGIMAPGDYNSVHFPLYKGKLHDVDKTELFYPGARDDGTNKSGFIKAAASFFENTAILRKENPKDSWRSNIIFETPPIGSLDSLACTASYKKVKRITHEKREEPGYIGKMGPLPDEAYEIMKKYALIKNVEYLFSGKCPEADGCVDPAANFAAIQKTDKWIVMRTFRTYIEYRYPLKDSAVHIKETKRDVIWEEDGSNNYRLPCDLIYADNLSGTYLEYTQEPMQTWLSMLKKGLLTGTKEKTWKGENLEEQLKSILMPAASAIKNFRARYKMNPYDTVVFAAAAKENPLVEKLYKLGDEKIMEFIGESLYSLYDDSFLEEKLGTIYEGDSPHKMLGIPKSFLLAAKGHMEPIGIAKYMFSTEQAVEYLKRMNDEDGKDLCKFSRWVESLKSSKQAYVKTSMLILFIMHGCDSWKSYAAHVAKICKEGKGQIYCLYLRMLLEIGDAASDADWKLSGDDIDRSVKSLEEAYRAATKTGGRFNRMIQARQEEFAPYAYTGEMYSVFYPESYGDIVNEGIALHHCAKEFIRKVAEGKTMLLFVRKAENPGKAFFTLEVRDGAVRQCHGKNNRNIGEEKGLEKFLEEYCKEKKIRFEGAAKCSSNLQA